MDENEGTSSERQEGLCPVCGGWFDIESVDRGGGLVEHYKKVRFTKKLTGESLEQCEGYYPVRVRRAPRVFTLRREGREPQR